MFVKLPTWLSTLLNASGRSQATVNAQMPPELMPPIAGPRPVGQFIVLAHLGQDLFQQEPGVLVAKRVVLEAAVARVQALPALSILLAGASCCRDR